MSVELRRRAGGRVVAVAAALAAAVVDRSGAREPAAAARRVKRLAGTGLLTAARSMVARAFPDTVGAAAAPRARLVRALAPKVVVAGGGALCGELEPLFMLWRREVARAQRGEVRARERVVEAAGRGARVAAAALLARGEGADVVVIVSVMRRRPTQDDMMIMAWMRVRGTHSEEGL